MVATQWVCSLLGILESTSPITFTFTTSTFFTVRSVLPSGHIHPAEAAVATVDDQEGRLGGREGQGGGRDKGIGSAAVLVESRHLQAASGGGGVSNDHQAAGTLALDT